MHFNLTPSGLLYFMSLLDVLLCHVSVFISGFFCRLVFVYVHCMYFIWVNIFYGAGFLQNK